MNYVTFSKADWTMTGFHEDSNFATAQWADAFPGGIGAFIQ